jgi:hypothetical protein
MHHFMIPCAQIVAILIMPNGFKQPMSGQIAVITGSRLKMGYLYYIDALRGGASDDCYDSFSNGFGFAFFQEPDFMDWSTRLMVWI